MCVYVHMCVPHVWGFPWRSEKGVDIRAPATGETGGCELSDVGGGTLPRILCKGDKCS